jgi:putative transcriptional regulator
MFRYRFKELIAEKEFREGRVVTMLEIAAETGVSRLTLSRLANRPGYFPRASVLDKLCAYFSCRIEQLVEHIPDHAHDRPLGGESRRKTRT